MKSKNTHTKVSDSSLKRRKLILPEDEDSTPTPPAKNFKPKNVEDLISYQEQEATRTLAKAAKRMFDEEAIRVYQKKLSKTITWNKRLMS